MDYLIEVYRVLEDEKDKKIEILVKLDETLKYHEPQKLSSKEVNKIAVDLPDSDEIYDGIKVPHENIKERYKGYHVDYENKAITTAVELYEKDVVARIQIKRVLKGKKVFLDTKVLSIGSWVTGEENSKYEELRESHWETVPLYQTRYKNNVLGKMNERVKFIAPFVDKVFNVGVFK